MYIYFFNIERNRYIYHFNELLFFLFKWLCFFVPTPLLSTAPVSFKTVWIPPGGATGGFCRFGDSGSTDRPGAKMQSSWWWLESWVRIPTICMCLFHLLLLLLFQVVGILKPVILHLDWWNEIYLCTIIPTTTRRNWWNQGPPRKVIMNPPNQWFQEPGVLARKFWNTPNSVIPDLLKGKCLSLWATSSLPGCYAVGSWHTGLGGKDVWCEGAPRCKSIKVFLTTNMILA